PEIGFADWGTRWLASLERKPSTVGSYRSTIAHASEAFGGWGVRQFGPVDIARFNRRLPEPCCSPCTPAKRLPVLGARLPAQFITAADSNAGTIEDLTALDKLGLRLDEDGKLEGVTG